MNRHVVARADEISVGDRKTVTVKGREIVIFNVKGEFYAMLNKCPHLGASLAHGVCVGLVRSSEAGQYSYTREGEFVRCPWHGWEFDIKTGQSYCDPKSTWVKQYDIKVEEGDTIVKGPLQATAFEVIVEDQYLVVEV